MHGVLSAQVITFLFSADVKAPLCHLILIVNSCFCALKAAYNLAKDDEQDSSESYIGVKDSFHWLKPFYSESNSFLEIKARNDVMPCDQEQEVQVDYILDQNKLSSEADHINFYYLVSTEDNWVSGQDYACWYFTIFTWHIVTHGKG